ncbi:MAG: hypothetical protein OEZ58_20010 [Gammaproteobacteria bacterium]|nr:hypothetical protein [Gammaproteobacteria bacterium]
MKVMRVLFLMMALLASHALFAENAMLINSSPYFNAKVKWLTLGLNETAAINSSIVQASEAATYKRRWLTFRKLHQYAGLGAITLATAAILSPKPEDEDEYGNEVITNPESGPHHALAEGATAMAALASATGLVFHLKDLNFASGFYKDPDNWHALLGALGTAGFVIATGLAGAEPHAVYGIAGYTSMLVAIKIVW